MNEARPGTVVNAAGFQAELAQGNALLAAGQGQEALDADRRAVGLAPDAGLGYYNLRIAARHDTVVFSHDDVELLSPRPFDAIAAALQTNDIVGIAGSRLVNGPAVLWAGHPHLHGHVAYPFAASAGYSATTFSLEGGIIGGMQALDGALVAARREAALAVGFDADAFDGFHFYDLDFSYRAHLAGLKVAVTTEVTALHE